MTLDRLVGVKVRVTIDEPTSYTFRHEDDLGEGRIMKVVQIRNAVGHPYDKVFVVLDRPFDWSKETLEEAPVRTQSTVVSATNAFTLRGLENLLSGKSASVHLTAEDPQVLEAESDDPRSKSAWRKYIGWASLKPVSAP